MVQTQVLQTNSMSPWLTSASTYVDALVFATLSLCSCFQRLLDITRKGIFQALLPNASYDYHEIVDA
jgi:hypothetical protein